MVTAAFVQARMGSRRLPGKVLAPLAGVPALLRIVDRLALVPALDRIVVLTTGLPSDDPVAALCAREGVAYVRGATPDALDTFHAAIGALAPDRVLRITGDCPLVDPEVVSGLLALFDSDTRLGYAGVATGALGRERGYRRFPDGLDAEVTTATALGEAYRQAEDPYEREHVTPYIWRRPERFPAAVLECESDLGDERWTVDLPEDLAYVEAVYDRLGERTFGWRDVLALGR